MSSIVEVVVGEQLEGIGEDRVARRLGAMALQRAIDGCAPECRGHVA